MLYLLGGASRSGKSKLARRLLAERGIPFLHLDLLMMGFARGLPAFGVDPDTSAVRRGEQLWPVVRAMAVAAIEDGVDYLFEGDFLLPRHAADLGRSYGNEIRAAFLGYAEIFVEQKLRAIREFGGEPNDWVGSLSDERVLEIVASNKEFSDFLRKECEIHALPYFDTSRDFPNALDAALRALAATPR